ncbi:cytochrome b562 [uncultured Neptuniibacter sp.]|uniref:cytochrome b562 n=1 Tax=uncultured Neptuniibacter sp. TaxID=502143 RepID=UPI00262E86C4|nr:cytochrome b562 [uncultured Neptuniibacter sp.]
MKHSVVKATISTLLVSALFITGSYVSAGEPLSLKQTMKQMKLQYKEAMDSRSAESFNQHMTAFKTHLDSAKGYDFSPERKVISLEGLNKVERLVDEIPLATADNLADLKQQLSSIDQLRKEYHKKAKPGTWELLLSIFK